MAADLGVPPDLEALCTGHLALKCLFGRFKLCRVAFNSAHLASFFYRRQLLRFSLVIWLLANRFYREISSSLSFLKFSWRRFCFFLVALICVLDFFSSLSDVFKNTA